MNEKLVGIFVCFLLISTIPIVVGSNIRSTAGGQTTEFEFAVLRGTISNIEKIGDKTYAHAISLHYFGWNGILPKSGIIKDKQIYYRSNIQLRHFYIFPRDSDTFVLGHVRGFNPAAEGQIPNEIIQYAHDWPLANKDYENTRATTDSTITSTNVAGLTLAWSYAIQGIGPYGGATSNPLIVNNTVYFQDFKANVIALDLQTGSVKWSKIYNDSQIVGPNGPAIGYGKVFAAKDLYNITALDMSSGDELWSTRISYVPTTGIDIQPIVYDGMVYVASVPGTGDVFYAPGGIGVIYALDQETGAILWNFSTVDPNLWGHPEINSGGGCWYPPAIDMKTNTIFWAIANPAPFAGTPGWPNGVSYAGPALYTNSLIALDHRTGKMKWFTQALAHDIFDHDLQISPILTNATISNIEREIVIAAGKMGTVYAFDRATGSLQWTVPVGKHENDTLDVLTGETKVLPGILGGVETCMAYSDSIVYVPVVDMSTNYLPEGVNYSSINFAAGKGELVAIDVNLGRILWTKLYDTLNVGAATVVNDVVFTATFDGKIYAYKAKTGEQVFTYQAPAGINAWPAVANDTIIWPTAVGGTPSLIALRL